MLEGKKIIVVMPAYNAEKTLLKTYNDIPLAIVDEVLVTDDFSTDKTVDLGKKIGLTVYSHKRNLGYGANQKTCYREALKRNADIVIMLHPDYQYPPRLITAPAQYTQESSSIGFKKSIKYGLGVIFTSMKFVFQSLRLARFSIFDENGRKLDIS